nr:MAG TPA: hypothetical protein [Caudoviricetes sp.]
MSHSILQNCYIVKLFITFLLQNNFKYCNMNKYITRLFPYITIYMHDIYILLHLFLINVTKTKQVYTFS